jgi:hypothetical protein
MPAQVGHRLDMHARLKPGHRRGVPQRVGADALDVGSLGGDQLPALVARLLINRRARAVQMRRASYRTWQADARERQAGRERDIDQHVSRSREQSTDYGLEL